MKERLSDEINEVKDDVEEYIKSQIDLVKLHTAESVSKFISGILINMVLFYVFFFVLLFISIALAFWLDRLLDSNGIGFILVAGFYFLFGIVFIAFRKKLIEKPVIKSVVQLFFPNYMNYDK